MQGVFAAIPTFFTPQNGIDFAATEKICQLCLEAGLDGVVCGGTTGESTSLSLEEKVTLFSFVQSRFGRDFTIIANTGSANTKESVQLTDRAVQLGIEEVLVIVPYYVKPQIKGIVAHFQEIAQVGANMTLYHHPNRTGVFLPIEAFELLQEIEAIKTIKECSGDMTFFSQLVTRFRFDVLTGNDDSYFKSLEHGGKGCISALAPLFPGLFTSCFKEKNQENRQAFHAFLPAITALFKEPAAASVKYVLSAKDTSYTPFVRLPLVELKRETKEEIMVAISGAACLL